MKLAPALLVAVAVAIAIAGCGGSSGRSSSSGTSSTSTAGAAARPAGVAATTAGAAATTTGAAATTAAANPAPPRVHLAAGFRLSSPAFRAGDSIPRVYTCDGRGTSPPLRWSGVPRATTELVLVMRDPDAPGGSFVHWALAGISPATHGFPAAGVTGQIVAGRNSAGSLGYTGPCPPKGAAAHDYVLTLIALASASGLRPGFTPGQLRSRALGIATLIGTYARS